jgi:hypothetical protein
MKLIRKLVQHPAAFPMLLLITMLAAYGYQITRLGFYWDDWPIVYLASLKDPQPFWTFYSFDRPLSAWLYVVLTPILGIRPVAWQLFAILTRWVGCLGFWVFFKQLWPERKLEAGFAALLLAIYPGFSQQPIAMTYSLFWVLYGLFIWSMVASLAAIENKKISIFLTILAVLASLLETLSMEYVIGLEILRPVFFFLVLARLGIQWKQAIKDALMRWIPYFLVLCGFVFYRFIYYPQIQTDPEANAPLLLREILSNPVVAIPHLFQNIIQDLSQALVFAWSKPIVPTEIDFTHTTTLFAYGIGLAAAVAAVLLLRKVASTDEANASDGRFPWQAILLGFTAVVMGGLPVWSTNRQIITGMWSDRFSLGLMFGAVILLCGLAGWFSQRSTQRAVFLSVFLALGVAFQVQNTAKYKLNWDAQKDYYNQMVWRAPNLAPGTAVLGNKIPFGLSAEYSTGFALNTIYGSKENSSLPYWFYSAISDRGGSIPDYVEGIPLRFELRELKYESTTSKGLVVYYKYGESCLRVMTPEDKSFPNMDDNETELLSLSHPDQIIVGGEGRSLPVDLFGPELPHGWCYYFQKADLAGQTGDWQAVLADYRQAEGSGLAPKNGTEYIPVIKALAYTGSWDEARTLTQKGLELTGSARGYFCTLWKSLGSLEGGDGTSRSIRQEMNCGES